MATNAYEAYLESKVMTADPVELVQLLCRAALDSVRQARAELRQGRIRERSRSISRASDILNELALSVDHGTGGDLSRNLVELYAYLQRLLIDGNSRQLDSPLEEAERLLGSLADAWQSCRPVSSQPSTQIPNEFADPSPSEYTPLSCTC
jgi:flagellar protein FliS